MKTFYIKSVKVCSLITKVIFLVTLFIIPAGFILAASPEWQNVGSAGFSAGSTDYISFAIDSNDVPYVGYRDGGNSNKATVMKYVDGSWTIVGTAGFSAGAAVQTSIAIDSDDVPYLAYRDVANSDKVTVMKYVDGAWENVGSAGFSAGSASYISLTTDSNNVPYVAFLDGANSSKATVMSYDGDSWGIVGSAGFSAGSVAYVSININSGDVPYVSYMDQVNGQKVTVMSYDGESWSAVGTAGFSGGQSIYVTLAFDTNDVPYVAYRDGSNSEYSSVMKYTEGSWALVGSGGFSGATTEYPSIAIDSDDVPYVAYSNGGNKAAVMKYTEGSWALVGEVNFSAGMSQPISIAIDSNDLPYVGYQDAGNSSKATVMVYRSSPEISETTAVPPSSTNTTPSYTFTSDQAGTISYGGSCSSSTLAAVSSTNTIIFNALSVGTYSDCTITVTNSTGQISNTLSVSAFVVIRASTASGSGGTSFVGRVRNLMAIGNKEEAEKLKKERPDLFTNETTSVPVTSTITPVFIQNIRNLESNMTGEDVKLLQVLLNSNGFLLANSGVGSVGNETDFFGPLTRSALSRYQQANNISPTVGYFGPITRAQMKAISLNGLWW